VLWFLTTLEGLYASDVGKGDAVVVIDYYVGGPDGCMWRAAVMERRERIRQAVHPLTKQDWSF